MWYLKKLNIFKKFADEKLYFEKVSKIKSYGRREQISGQGEDLVYLLKEGRVRLFKKLPEDKELTLVVLASGDIWGEIAQKKANESETYAETLDETILYVLKRDSFIWLLKKRPRLSMSVTKWHRFHPCKIENSLRNLAFRSVPSRLAYLLMLLATKYRLRRGCDLNIKLSHRKLSLLIAAEVETTDKTLSDFERLGIISIKRNRIKILNQWKLKQVARKQKNYQK